MTPKCPTCGAPVDLSPDSPPRYIPLADRVACESQKEIDDLTAQYDNLLRAVWCMGERVLPIGNYKPEQAPLICNDVAEAYHQMKASRGKATEQWGF